MASINVAATMKKLTHPKTGEKGSVKDVLYYVIKELNKLDSLERGTYFHISRKPMQKYMVDELRIALAHVADFLLVAQEVGVMKTVGRGSKAYWQICDIDVFEDITTDATVTSAMRKVSRRHEKTEKIGKQAKEIKRLEEALSSVHGSQEPSDEVMTQIAELIVEVESLQEKNAALQQQLSEQQKQNPADTLAAAIAAARKKK